MTKHPAPGSSLTFGFTLGGFIGLLAAIINGLLLGNFIDSVGVFLFALVIGGSLGLIGEAALFSKSSSAASDLKEGMDSLDEIILETYIPRFLRECKERDKHFFISLIDKTTGHRLDMTSEGYPHKRVKTMRAKE